MGSAHQIMYLKVPGESIEYIGDTTIEVLSSIWSDIIASRNFQRRITQS